MDISHCFGKLGWYPVYGSRAILIFGAAKFQDFISTSSTVLIFAVRAKHLS